MKGKWHFIAGIGFILSFFSTRGSTWPGMMIVLGMLLIMWRSARTLRLFLLICFGAVIVFTGLAKFHSQPVPPDGFGKPQAASVTGKIVSAPSISPDQISFVFRHASSHVQSMVFMTSDGTSAKMIRRGAMCQIKGSLEIPETARNPGNFDYRNYLYHKGIHYVMFAEVQNAECSGQSVLAYMDQLRLSFLRYLKQKYPDDTLNWIRALIFGSDDDLSADTIHTFREWNLSHLLAISGLHTGLVMMFVYAAGRYLFRLTEQQLKIVLMIALLVFLGLSGGKPSVLRAVIMAESALLLSILKKTYPVTDIISMTAITLMFLNPFIVNDIGFQFSFIVTYALVFSKKLLIKHSSFLWPSIQISFISQIVLIPLQLYYFFYIHPLSFFLNILIVPYFTFFVIPASLFLVIFAWLPVKMTNAIAGMFEGIHNGVIQFIHLVDSWHDGVWVIGQISEYTFICYLVLFFSFMHLWEQERLREAFFCGCLLVCLLVLESMKPYFTAAGSITMLDVGQGDTIVIELPKREGVIMIDAAGTDTEGENDTFTYRIKPFLWSKGISQIDHFIITHTDQDHAGSADEILDNFDVKHVYSHPFLNSNNVQESLSSNHTYHPLSQGMKLQLGTHELYVLHPEQNVRYDSENNRSLVLYGQFGGLSFLFTGDIDAQVEEEIIQRFPSLQADVLKISHHGSKYSTSERFLEKMVPDIAWISAGIHNRYGHPAPEVLDRLSKQGTHIFRTDRDGAVIFCFTEQNGTFSKMIP
ncbi:competence protein ComEC [Melghiribacillus thermohalophilus]|uniref:Competence protein ComEC n=1 Tax=Melghiribacillus thermohalophilus TaxID=1324956 RepID=A0A4R3NC49_9BACI|nr:DNA internalization-related competence protein ComEC/Rec2 [Melghiribacillus thermohalophilus]TCT27044.1 competence protein ComEC [Melghiribacillus thermohalophilus]